jgi:hypothetical protein
MHFYQRQIDLVDNTYNNFQCKKKKEWKLKKLSYLLIVAILNLTDVAFHWYKQTFTEQLHVYIALPFTIE